MLLPNDIFCRAAVYPKCWEKGEFSNASFLKFSGKNTNVRSLSLASKYLCRTDCGVHDYGKKVADAGNKRILDSNTPIDQENENIYLGFYSILRKNILELYSDFVDLRLYWKEENGDDRHFQLDIYPKMNIVEKAVDEKISSEREDALKRGKAFTEPNKARRLERHVDQEIREIRRIMYENLFGPVKLETESERILDLQKDYMVILPAA